MARWRLIEPHYLVTTDPTKWEYQETDRISGRPKRTTFEVPRYIHHEDPLDWTVRETPDYGYVVVSDGHNAEPRDIVFKGSPTPGMIPLDDEAKEISARFSDKWNTPTQGLADNEPNWAMKMADTFVQSAEKINMKMLEASQQPVPGMDQFMSVMTKMMEQQQTMFMTLMGKQMGLEPIVDNLEKLDG